MGLLECIIIGWFFKTRRFKDYINSVSEIKIGLCWDILTKVVTPAILGISIGMSLVERFKIRYEGYPQWALIAGGWGVATGLP